MAKKIVIIGSGSAGYVAAIRAAQLGAGVMLIESGDLGGVCTNVGCIPTKTFFHFAELAHEIGGAKRDGVISGELSFDWMRMLRKKDAVVKRLVAGIGFLLKKNRIELIEGRGTIVGRGVVEVRGNAGELRRIECDDVLVATGSVPRSIPIEGWDGVGIWSNTEALAAERVPKSLLIIGGGVIGCEFAHIFSTFGCKVTIVEVMDHLLPGLDSEIVDVVTKALVREGVSIRTGVGLERLERSAEGVVAYFGDERFEAEEVLGAVGRRPTPPDGIEGLGVKLERGAVSVDANMRAADGIWGAGDVCGPPFLAHWASAMGETAVENILGAEKSLDVDAVPGAFFTALEVGTVGLTEEQARDRFGSVSVGHFPYMASGRARSASATDGFAKVVADPKRRIVGIHIAGKQASEMLGAASLAVSRRLTIDDWKKTIIAHPTFVEILKEATLDSLGEAIHI